jgi:hypothetical protein
MVKVLGVVALALVVPPLVLSAQQWYVSRLGLSSDNEKIAVRCAGTVVALATAAVMEYFTRETRLLG